MLPCQISFATPRKLPKVRDVDGRVVVLDIAFAGLGRGFEKITLPFIEGLGPRLRGWVDHHDHEEHGRFASDSRFVLATKAEHGACPEMVTPDVVRRIGEVDTIVCHTDFDGIASGAKWMLGGQEPYPGCDADARAIDTRIGVPSAVAERIDRALRARPRDIGLFGVIVRHLYSHLADESLWTVIDAAAAELVPIERETRRAAAYYGRLEPGVAVINVEEGFRKIDKTLLLLLGQEQERVAVVIDRDNVSVAAAYDSGLNFIELLGLSGGMPTRVSVPRQRAVDVLVALGVYPSTARDFG
jgi:hypothetical protein